MAWDREKERKAGKAMSIGSSIFGVVFIIIWCVLAASMGAWVMLLFGVPMLGMMVYRLYICVQYTKADDGKNQSDPWDQPAAPEPSQRTSGSGNSCLYCGFALQDGFAFCPKCGRKQS